MSLFNIMGLLSTAALVMPIITMLIFKLAWYRTFPALFIYFFILFTYNLILLGYVPAGTSIRLYHGIINNLLDAPLLLSFLVYFCRTVSFRKFMRRVLLLFITGELIVIALYGISARTSVIVTGPGLLITLVFAIIFFVHQIKITVIHHKASGKAMIVSAIFFATVGFSYLYTVYYLINTPFKQDAHLLFFLITIFYSVSMTIGLFFEEKRVRQLAELKITRQELRALYGEGQAKTKTPPFEAIVFNFDKKQWN